jgi:GNAT superfamily N-acetyltransferase
MEVRVARADDVDAVVEVLRRSITELREADHHNDEQVLAGWLANKTPAMVRHWISRTGQQVVVAIVAGQIAGVGAASKEGTVLLNYVSPDHRGKGISTAVLLRLEDYMISQGVGESCLQSTITAQAFYRKRGYRGDISAQESGTERAMRKPLRQ